MNLLRSQLMGLLLGTTVVCALYRGCWDATHENTVAGFNLNTGFTNVTGATVAECMDSCHLFDFDYAGLSIFELVAHSLPFTCCQTTPTLA